MLDAWRSRLRYRWFLATRTLGYTEDYLQRLYRIYLNHDKVVHYRDGCPVYSLTTPAVFSKPAANFFARMLYRSIQNRNLPNAVGISVTDLCDAACEHCGFYGAVEDRSRRVLNLEQMRRVVKESLDLGVSLVSFVGGEPTLREDLPDIIAAVDKDLAATLVFTNGSMLAEKVGQYRKAGLDSVFVSIDSADPEEHDRFRRVPGLFAKAVRGIEAAKRAGLSTGISTTMTPESFRHGELQAVIELGRRLGVHEVLVFDALPTGRYKHREDLVADRQWVNELVEAIVPYNRDPRYPGVLAWSYLTSARSVGCACGTSYFSVSPYGDVMSCDFNHQSFGNLLETPLPEIWDHMTSLEDFQRATWGGCKVANPAFRMHPTVRVGHSGRRPDLTAPGAPERRSDHGSVSPARRGATN